MNSDEIRDLFLKFFEEKGHKVIPSSSLVPKDDPTLLLTSAGMVQIKPYFLGQAVPPSRRLASCQKCFRTTDIEEVGDATHLTFFEMLGNFSVGDYFKKETIEWAFEFITQRLKIPAERLWVTVYLDDDEASEHWRRVGIPAERIHRFGEEHNFWGPVGDSGPCGPDNEIFYDFGPEKGCGRPDCKPNCDCERFTEISTLVFMQYDQAKDGHRSSLPRPSVDTGMGLERTAAILQGKSSVYETDLFAELIKNICEFTGKKYGADAEDDRALRVVVEHGRAMTFLVADGVLPANDGRGYVLRRLIRRAALFGRRLGLERPFLSEIASEAVKKMSSIYPELLQRRELIDKTIELEESRFMETLNVGLEMLAGEISQLRDKARKIGESFQNIVPPELYQAVQTLGQQFDGVKNNLMPVFQQFQQIAEDMNNSEFLKEVQKLKLQGKEAFKLYDTYGFPIELTKEIVPVDIDGFEREMAKQRERARAGQKFDNRAGSEAIKLNVSGTEFVGYRRLEQPATIAMILADNKEVESIGEGQEADIVLDTSPFYAEMGGQVGDTGEIAGLNGRFSVTDTVPVPTDVNLHHGIVTEGRLAVGDAVTAFVDTERRKDIARNHTATHLLQAALREVLGEHIQQRGSLVAPDRLRFDFSHLAAMTPEEIRQVQEIVNDKIRQNLRAYDEETSYREAVRAGAIALFDEKYGETVRVMKIGEPAVSTELCGGTHVESTGEIGFFHIVSEGSIGAGLRRIEAVTGRGAENFVNQRLAVLDNIARSLEATPENAGEKVAGLMDELEKERKRMQSLEREQGKSEAITLLDKVEKVGNVNIVAARVNAASQEALRNMADVIRDKLPGSIVVLGAVSNDRPIFIAAVSPDLVEKGYNAGDIIKQVSKVTGGGGGGKASFAQAGGRDKTKLDEALNLVRALVADGGK